MRQRYVVYHEGKGIGWVNAATAEKAIQKVCKVTGREPADCTATLHAQTHEGGRRGSKGVRSKGDGEGMNR